jgi:hypothetical protein
MPFRRPRNATIGFLAAVSGLIFLGFACRAPASIIPLPAANDNASALSSWFRKEPSITFNKNPDGSGTAVIAVLSAPGTSVSATLDSAGITEQHEQVKNADANGSSQFFWDYGYGGYFDYTIEVLSNNVVVATYTNEAYSK